MYNNIIIRIRIKSSMLLVSKFISLYIPDIKLACTLVFLDLSIQSFSMLLDVVLNERSNEVVAMVVALLHS